jgi:tyrosyl-tRNA synthetase
LNRAKEILAWELTALVHGEEEADQAQNAARSLFAGAGSQENVPETVIGEESLQDGEIGLPALLVLAELCKSRSDARTNINQGGVSIDGVTVTDFNRKITEEELREGILLRRGKKNYKRIVLK